MGHQVCIHKSLIEFNSSRLTQQTKSTFLNWFCILLMCSLKCTANCRMIWNWFQKFREMTAGNKSCWSECNKVYRRAQAWSIHQNMVFILRALRVKIVDATPHHGWITTKWMRWVRLLLHEYSTLCAHETKPNEISLIMSLYSNRWFISWVVCFKMTSKKIKSESSHRIHCKSRRFVACARNISIGKNWKLEVLKNSKVKRETSLSFQRFVRRTKTWLMTESPVWVSSSIKIVWMLPLVVHGM